jgi:transposase
MMCDAGIDLHATNSVVGVLDEEDRVLYQKRLRNELALILTALAPYRATLQGIAVESTSNWYWLVDGLMDTGYRMHLAHAPALPQYSGLKHADDLHDARWLAHLLRLGLLPTGYIYPKAERAVRDLLRKRSQLVRHKTMVVLSLQSLLTRLTGSRVSLPQLRQLTPDGVHALVPFPEPVQSVLSSLTVLQCLEQQIRAIEHVVREASRVQPGYALLQTVNGIGPILALTILLEAGDMRRFPTVGHFASYCRCVGSEHVSNGTRKGAGNTKNGNTYWSWAFIEAAHVAIRYEAVLRGFYQRKHARSHPLVALKAVAHKLARACYHVLRDQVPFDLRRAFG